MVRGEGTTVATGVTPDQAFDFVLDPAQYTKADTKMIWVTKLADTPDGMLAREDGKFLGRFRGSVITRYRWERPSSIDVTLEHGVPRRLHAWFKIDAVDGGTRIHHVEELDIGHGPLGWLHDLVAGNWFARSVDAEVAEIGRLLQAGERGRGVAGAHGDGAAEEGAVDLTVDHQRSVESQRSKPPLATLREGHVPASSPTVATCADMPHVRLNRLDTAPPGCPHWIESRIGRFDPSAEVTRAGHTHVRSR